MKYEIVRRVQFDERGSVKDPGCIRIRIERPNDDPTIVRDGYRPPYTLNEIRDAEIGPFASTRYR